MENKTAMNDLQSNRKRLKKVLEIFMSSEITKGVTPERLKNVLQNLGPMFTRAGQIIAARPDILSKEFRDSMIGLQDYSAPIDYFKMKEIIEKEFGASIDEIFSEIDETPLELSALWQSHKAKLLDGSEVLLKIQDPQTLQTITEEFAIVKKALAVLNVPSKLQNGIDLNRVIDEIFEIIKQELNCTLEAENTSKFFDLNEDIHAVVSPRVKAEYTKPHVFVAEYIGGPGIAEVEMLDALGYNLNTLANNLAENFVKQFLHTGFFHANPCNENVLVKNGKLVWTNFSIMGALSAKEKQALKETIQAMKSAQISVLKRALLKICVADAEIDDEAFSAQLRELVAEFKCSGCENLDLSEAIRQILVLLRKNGLYLPDGFSKLCSALMAVDKILSILDPSVRLAAVIYKEAGEGDFSEEIEAEERTEEQEAQEGEGADLLAVQAAAEVPEAPEETSVPEEISAPTEALGTEEIAGDVVQTQEFPEETPVPENTEDAPVDAEDELHAEQENIAEAEGSSVSADVHIDENAVCSLESKELELLEDLMIVPQANELMEIEETPADAPDVPATAETELEADFAEATEDTIENGEDLSVSESLPESEVPDTEAVIEETQEVSKSAPKVRPHIVCGVRLADSDTSAPEIAHFGGLNEHRADAAKPLPLEGATIDRNVELISILRQALAEQANTTKTANQELISSLRSVVNTLVLCLISLGLLGASCFLFTIDTPLKFHDLPVLGLVAFAISVVSMLCLIIKALRRR